MKILIMAAGYGSRISRHLQNQPKCCVDINGKPLIRYTFELLKRKGITNIGLVSGYQEKFIHHALEGFQYTRYFNPFYRVTNSIASAWFARDFFVGEDMIIMNGDVFLEDSILDTLLEESMSPLMLADSSRVVDADYRLNWEGNILKKYGKDLSNDETTGEYVGIARLSREYLVEFRQNIFDHISKENYNFWWEDVIYRTIDNGAVVNVKDIKGSFWAEIDYIEDYQRIIKHLNK